METLKKDTIRQHVMKVYGKIAKAGGFGCGCASSCCGTDLKVPRDLSEKLGYSADDLATLPEGADMGLSCGNPQAIAGIQEGETVLDLGSGGGFDCFLAAKKAGKSGKVIGVDMTAEMIAKARTNAEKGGYENVEFRLGEIEHLPVADNSVDAVISNCVINLSPDKALVFRDIHRVLKPGGRVAVSDIVAIGDMPEKVKNDLEQIAGCVAGAARIEEIERDLAAAGFIDISIKTKDELKELAREWMPGTGVENYVVSAIIEAKKADQ